MIVLDYIHECSHAALEWAALTHAVGLTDGIFKLILRRTRSRQIVLLLGAAAAMPTLYLTLEIPKHIINHAIGAGRKLLRWEE